MIDFAVSSGLVFIHVILSCSLDANVTRVVDPGRIALNEALKLQGYAAVAAEITTDPEALVTTRMEEEIGHVAPFLKGLSGEYELETTLMDAKTAAGVLAEYCLDTLRREGWWIQLNSMMRK